jgi:hypothetical protein
MAAGVLSEAIQPIEDNRAGNHVDVWLSRDEGAGDIEQ